MNDPLENEGKTSGQVDVHIMPMLKQGWNKSGEM